MAHKKCLNKKCDCVKDDIAELKRLKENQKTFRKLLLSELRLNEKQLRKAIKIEDYVEAEECKNQRFTLNFILNKIDEIEEGTYQE